MKYMWIIVIVLLTSGCDRDREERTVHIAVSLAGTDIITLTKHIQGITDAAEDENITVTWRTAMMDQELQRRQLDTLLAEVPDIIVVEIADARKADELFVKIKQSGLPVVGFNRLAPGFQYDLIVRPDYKSIGHEIAEIVIEKYDRRKKNVLLLHGLLFNDQESIFIERFLNSIEQFDNFDVKKVEAVHIDNGPTGHIDIPDIDVLLKNMDIAIATNPFLTRSLIAGIMFMDKEGVEHRAPLIAGFDEREIFTFAKIEYDNLLLIDRQPYNAGIRLIDAAADYARGAFRHLDGPVIRIGAYVIPVIYTPHTVKHGE